MLSFLTGIKFFSAFRSYSGCFQCIFFASMLYTLEIASTKNVGKTMKILVTYSFASPSVKFILRLFSIHSCISTLQVTLLVTLDAQNNGISKTDKQLQYLITKTKTKRVVIYPLHLRIVLPPSDSHALEAIYIYALDKEY